MVNINNNDLAESQEAYLDAIISAITELDIRLSALEEVIGK